MTVKGDGLFVGRPGFLGVGFLVALLPEDLPAFCFSMKRSQNSLPKRSGSSMTGAGSRSCVLRSRSGETGDCAVISARRILRKAWAFARVFAPGVLAIRSASGGRL